MLQQNADPEHANILVVDDTPENLRLLMGILSEQGYAVRPASDGEFAIQSAQADPADLILLDVKMPGLNGYEVCQQLKADDRTRRHSDHLYQRFERHRRQGAGV